MNTDVKRQTTLRVTYSKLPEWHYRLRKMQQCATLDALVTLCGPPHHKAQQGALEIWHYPLGVESGMVYSIHVSVSPDQSRQVILHFAPAPRRRWWHFWKRKDETPTQQRACI